MKMILASMVAAWLVFAAGVTSAPAASGPPAVGQDMPQVTLPAPKDPAGRAYLGLAGPGKFSIGQIKARVVIIEIYSMYCPYCQREAPHVNRLYRMIQSDPRLRGKIKLIGIGAGNSPFEIEVFRKKYRVPFPLVPDEKFVVHRLWGKTRTPYFFGVLLQPGRAPRVIYAKLSSLGDLRTLLDRLARAAGL
jgi:peroxiredoxin